MTSLAALAIGSSGTIAAISGTDAIAMRLLEMGLTPGEEITLLGFAPLGDPIEYSVRGYRITLRTAEADRVQIEPA